MPPRSIVVHLRIEGIAVAAAAIVAYAASGQSWWLFAALILAPDLSFLGWMLGPERGAHIYNAAHNYAVAAVLGLAGWWSGSGWLLAIGLVWATHIGIDRAVGYGLKYPANFHMTHLGPMGRQK